MMKRCKRSCSIFMALLLAMAILTDGGAGLVNYGTVKQQKQKEK